MHCAIAVACNESRRRFSILGVRHSQLTDSIANTWAIAGQKKRCTGQCVDFDKGGKTAEVQLAHGSGVVRCERMAEQTLVRDNGSVSAL